MICFDLDGTSALVRADLDSGEITELARLPGVTAGGVWLDRGRTLAIDLGEPGGALSGYLIDLVEGTFYRIFHLSDVSNDMIAQFDQLRGRLVVSTDAFGYRRAGVGDLHSGRKVTFLPDVQGEDRSVDPCALTANGLGLVLRRQRGVFGELWLADLGEMSTPRRLALPEGQAERPIIVRSGGDRVHFPFSSPTVPTVCAEYQLSEGLFRLKEVPELGALAASELATPRVASFNGPRGALEALVYDPPRPGGLRGVVVVALHGGPVNQWSAAFTPEFQLLTRLGATVAAVNAHGSTGYGHNFVRALEGQAGSVDADDVVAVIVALRRKADSLRPTVVLYGESYGAFLALLVAMRRPDLVDGVIALAPFASTAGFNQVASPPVGKLLRLIFDPAHPEATDLLSRAGELQCKLLVAHGTSDSTIPVQESRALVRVLRAAGYLDGVDLWSVELPGEEHALTGRQARLRFYGEMESFLSAIGSKFDGRRSSQSPVLR